MHPARTSLHPDHRPEVLRRQDRARARLRRPWQRHHGGLQGRVPDRAHCWLLAAHRMGPHPWQRSPRHTPTLGGGEGRDGCSPPCADAWDVGSDGGSARQGLGQPGPRAHTIWSEKLCWPCDNWFIGFTNVPGATPSQQAQESWHNWGVMQRLSGELHASTTYLLEVSLAKVMTLDGEITYACNPNTCNAR